MIEVTIHDILAKVAREETLAHVDLSAPPSEQSQWVERLNLYRVVLLAEKEGKRLMPMGVGPTAGEGLVLQMQGRSPGRPLTFDLIKELFIVAKMELQSVIIGRLHEKIYYSTLVIKTEGDDSQEIDCRPSDAINLALRMEAPILVAPEVMAEHGFLTEEDENYTFLAPHLEAGEQWVSLLKG